jgi:serine/threonine protein kinase
MSAHAPGPMSHAALQPGAAGESYHRGAAARVPAIRGYRVRCKLGEGRRGRVYLAADGLGHLVAVKVIREAIADKLALKWVVRERALLAAIDHPRVVHGLSHGVCDMGPFLAMEFLGGGTARNLMREPLPPERAFRIVYQAAEALAVVHGSGIVHRDVKPENLMLRESGEVVLTDFGVAVQRARTAWRSEPGRLVGTPRYAAPEQGLGAEPAATADVYSLGVLFYELLRGRPPFAGETVMELMSQHLMADVPRLSGELAVYQPLVQAMLTKKPAERLRDGVAVVRALDEIRAGCGGVPPRPP